jgi:hypothetical protein
MIQLIHLDPGVGAQSLRRQLVNSHCDQRIRRDFCGYFKIENSEEPYFSKLTAYVKPLNVPIHSRLHVV